MRYISMRYRANRKNSLHLKVNFIAFSTICPPHSLSDQKCVVSSVSVNDTLINNMFVLSFLTRQPRR